MQAMESDFKENRSKYIDFLWYLNPEEISEQWDLSDSDLLFRRTLLGYYAEGMHANF